MKRILATLVLFCLAFAAGCGDGREKVRNWQSPDGKFRMDIPEGWRETSPPQGFFVQFRAPRADDNFYATITVEVRPVPEEQTFQEHIRRADLELAARHPGVEFLERLELDAEGLDGRGVYIRRPAGRARLKMLRAYFIQGSDFYIITCTSLEKHFGSHLAGFQKTCRSFYPKPKP